MNKITLPVYITWLIVLSSLTSSLGILFLPSPSIAAREYFYKNCAELQKVMNDYNPGKRFEGFEKVKMIRRSLEYDSTIVFCNGGIITNKQVGTICRGYIGYSFSRVPAVAHYYSRWGKATGLPNDNDTGEGNYCRWIK